MTTDYKLRINNPSGVLQAEITDFLSLDYLKVVNGPGRLNFVLKGNHHAVPALTDKALIEVWRRNVQHEIDWYCDFYTMFRDEEQSYRSRRDRFMALCDGVNAILGWRIVNWPAETANRNKFTGIPAENIMEAIVNYNCGAGATTGNGRKRNGTITGLSVASSSGLGNVVDWTCFGDNVLETLQKLALIAGGDFDLVTTGPAAWTFTFFENQLGTDRSATLTFSLGYGNMAEPEYSIERSPEKTVACVWGKGETVNRAYVTRTGDNYSASNDIEVFVDAAGTSGTTDAYNAFGDRKLKELKASDDFSFKVLQTPASLYGKHYFLGDKITGVYKSISKVIKITSVGVSFQGSKETIQIGMDNIT